MWKLVLYAFLATLVEAQYNNPVPVVGAPPPPPPPPPYPEKEVYGVDTPYRDPAPAHYPPPRPPPPPPPAYPPHHHPPYDSSEESMYETCNSCYKLKTTCHDTPRGYRCEKPRVTYFTKMNGCQRAVLTCRGGERDFIKIVTKYDEVLTEGYAADKLLKCKKGRWTTYDIDDREREFRTVRCLRKKEEHHHHHHHD
ncbi:hypothetical protein Y032_0003g1323 [Ancylostoma ceylanicum]|uniref:Uncharacterized protein n=1 Tax=Ancylostoma ceylanicum TaxID=53326 RepID=A0A016VX11_9BILA|nr:hypothetical protein Y032_0003g1323 [Ancylostoma ceylanicum]